jgi:hypothetical protein
VCLTANPGNAGAVVVKGLQGLLDQGPLTCDVVGEPDVFGRLLARCSVNDQNVNEETRFAGIRDRSNQ